MHKSILKIGVVTLLSLLVFSCQNVEDVVFVTKTSLSVADFDTVPPGISIGYDRMEGFIGPVYEDGTIPPVAGSFRSALNAYSTPEMIQVFNPKVKQLYATGEAAELIVSTKQYNVDCKSDGKIMFTGKKKRMIFGSNTSLGLRISKSNNLSVLLLGYRRKEASFIPIVGPGNNSNCSMEKNGESSSTKVYGSVLASVDNTLKRTDGNSIFASAQYFATGEAAKRLAAQPYVRKIFREETETTIQPFGSAEQNELIWRSLSCAVYIEKHEQWESIVKSAYALKLFLKSSAGGQEAEALGKEFEVSLKNLNDKQSSENAVKLLRTYSAYLKAGRRLDREYTISSLIKHKDLVCCFARTRTSKSIEKDSNKCINDYNKEI